MLGKVPKWCLPVQVKEITGQLLTISSNVMLMPETILKQRGKQQAVYMK